MPKKLRIALQALLVYTLLVILWGAWVRISHSGDGCGESWPLCHGQLIPGQAPGKTWVEYAHRAMSGVYGLVVLALFFWVRAAFVKGHPARWYAGAMLIFTITEALLGAKLVLFGLVSQNQSWFRTVAMSLHQVNSLLLTGMVFLTYLASSQPFRWHRRWFLVLFLVIATTGAWAALASTLFPSTTLLEGMSRDFAADSHHTLRLRVLHPLVAILCAGGMALWMYLKSFESKADEKRNRATAAILAVAVVFGILTLFSLSPAWMKLTHLAMAQISWIALLRWSALSVERT